MGLAHHIIAGQEWRDAIGLDCRGFLITDRSKGEGDLAAYFLRAKPIRVSLFKYRLR